MSLKLDYAKIQDVEMHIDTSDAPDFTGCYIASATYDGREMTADEIDALNDDHDYVYTKVLQAVY